LKNRIGVIIENDNEIKTIYTKDYAKALWFIKTMTEKDVQEESEEKEER
jgi:hypothetical protein